MDHSLGDEATLGPSEAQQAPELEAGDRIDVYRVIRLLGRGGMGEVYEVEHEKLGTRYALKIIPSRLASRPGFVERFEREARVMANLDHPGIVRVSDFRQADGRYWIRMELMRGVRIRTGDKTALATSLADLAALCDSKVPQRALADLVVAILDALGFAHNRGAVHRDLKPRNILLETRDRRPFPRISDFGLVRLVGEEWVRQEADSLSSQPTLQPDGSPKDLGSSSRALVGTYEFMSPEQKQGHEVDARSDLYAVGLMTFRLLTGHKDFSFDLPTQIDPKLAKGWDDIVRRALRPSPSDRFQTAEEMRDAVAAMLAQSTQPSAPGRPPEAEPEIEAEPAPEVKPVLREKRKRRPAGPAAPEPRATPHGKRKGGCLASVAAVLLAALIVAGVLFALRSALSARDGLGIPPRWTTERRVVKVMTPEGEGATSISYYRNSAGMEFVKIPAGGGMMGNGDGDSAEKPVHPVRISRPFYMQAREVTTGQYRAFLEASAYDGMHDADKDYLKSFRDISGIPEGGRTPIVYVSWHNARAFCRWLSQKEGAVYRLPTEAEWEYACRGGSRTRFYSGDDEATLSRVAWHKGNSASTSSEVGRKLPNAFGLWDMSGNVWEWCQSLSEGYPYAERDGREDLSSDGSRAVRGGSWLSVAGKARSGHRRANTPTFTNGDVGFRVVVLPRK